jgi:hypothetical protein
MSRAGDGDRAGRGRRGHCAARQRLARRVNGAREEIVPSVKSNWHGKNLCQRKKNYVVDGNRWDSVGGVGKCVGMWPGVRGARPLIIP